MSDYGTMQTRIADELLRSDLTSQIKLAIQTAIKHHERKRFWFNETITSNTVSTVADQANYDVPSDYVFLDKATITQNSLKCPLRPIDWSTYRDLEDGLSTGGYPEFIAEYGEDHWLYPVPTSVMTLTRWYVKRLSTLSDSGDTNAWMVEGEELIRQRAKIILNMDVLKNPQEAALAGQMEASALSVLRAETARRTATGRVRATTF